MKWLQYGLSRMPMFDADKGGSGGGSGNEGGGSGSGSQGENGSKSEGGANSSSGKADGNSDNKTDAKTHTQADIDKAVKDRLARQQKVFDKAMEDLKKQMNPEAATGGTGTGSADGQQGTGDNGAAAAQALLAAANQRLVAATAVTEAVKLGVDPKFTGDVVKLADLSKIEVKEDGTMDTGAIAKAIDEVLKRVPVFKTTTDNAGGFKVGGEGQKAPATNGWNNNGQAGANQQGVFKPWNKYNR